MARARIGWGVSVFVRDGIGWGVSVFVRDGMVLG